MLESLDMTGVKGNGKIWQFEPFFIGIPHNFGQKNNTLSDAILSFPLIQGL